VWFGTAFRHVWLVAYHGELGGTDLGATAMPAEAAAAAQVQNQDC
jgi:hypothetical protein